MVSGERHIGKRTPSLCATSAATTLPQNRSANYRDSATRFSTSDWHRLQMEKIFNHKSFKYFYRTPLGSRVNIDKFFLQVHFMVPAAWYCSHYLPPVSTTPAVPGAKYPSGDTGGAPRIFEKIRNDPNVSFRALGKMIYGKNLKKKISWHSPFLLTFLQSYPTLTQFSFHDRVWRLTRGCTIPTSRSLRASTALSGSDTPAPFSFTSECTQVSQ